MAKKFKFGVTQEDVEREEAQRMRELEAKVQERNLKRDKKLEQLNRKNKTNKAILIVIFILVFGAFAVFGTYNTFFKTPLQESDVQEMIKANSERFNDAGVPGFIYDNINTLFSNYAFSGAGIETVEIDLNSLRITKIVPINASLASVRFEFNINTKKRDTNESVKGETVVVEGETLSTSYHFSIFVGYNSEGGYYTFMSDPELLSYESRNDSEIYLSSSLAFPEKTEVDKELNNSIMLKIERILSDLYEGKDTGGDFEPELTFNTTDVFNGISVFQMHTVDNSLGYNAVAKFDVTKEDGITFNNTVYLKVEESGSSWKITRFL